MKRFFCFLLSLTLIFAFTSCKSTSQESDEKFDFKSIISANDYFEDFSFYNAETDDTVHYMFHKPIRDTGKSYPLIIFLHAYADTVNKSRLGTAGTFVNSLITLENENEKYSAYTLVPSTPFAEEGGWTSSQLDTFKELIYHLIEIHNIDEKRVYISGISMGGFTTCQLLNEMPPNTFAAAVPLSGAKNMTNPKSLHNTAFRIYHSTNDTVVNVSCARNLYNQLIRTEHPNVKYTEFEEGDHISPLHSVYVYDCHPFFNWLFAQHLP